MIALAVLMLGACGDSTGGATTAPATARPTATPAGPPVATASLVGDSGLGGAINATSIGCLAPTLDGPVINVFGKAADAGVDINLTVQSGAVTVQLSSGSGTAFHSRVFTGTGVAGFDAARGAQLNSPLTEKTPAGSPGSIGAITSIVGSIDCGNETAGTSTITVTGATPDGTLAGPLTSVRVACITFSGGHSIQVLGLTTTGNTATLLVVSMAAGSLSVSQVVKGAPQSHYYTNSAAGLATLSTTSVHVDGIATQAAPAGGTAQVHVSGDATCGLSEAF